MHFTILNMTLIKPCISYLFYSPARLYYLVPDIEPADVETEHANEAVEPPLEREWQPNNVM